MQIKEVSTSDYHDIIRENLALYLQHEVSFWWFMSLFGYVEGWTKTKQNADGSFFPVSLKFKIEQNSLLQDIVIFAFIWNV